MDPVGFGSQGSSIHHYSLFIISLSSPESRPGAVSSDLSRLVKPAKQLALSESTTTEYSKWSSNSHVYFLDPHLHHRYIPISRIVTLAGLLWSGRPAPTTDAAAATSAHEIMTEASSHPKLSPQFCFTTTALRDFLRVSRGAVDDSISQNLNALVTPARSGFDPTSTSVRAPRTSSRQIDARSCQSFKERVLFPSWQARSDVLTYCAYVATSPDPHDPEIGLRAAESEKNRERVVDERLDPYSARYFPREPRTEQLALLLRQERGVEKIVRSRTWDLIQERCGEESRDFEEALNKWRDVRERHGR